MTPIHGLNDSNFNFPDGNLAIQDVYHCHISSSSLVLKVVGRGEGESWWTESRSVMISIQLFSYIYVYIFIHRQKESGQLSHPSVNLLEPSSCDGQSKTEAERFLRQYTFDGFFRSYGDVRPWLSLAAQAFQLDLSIIIIVFCWAASLIRVSSYRIVRLGVV